jgi:subtilisin family serine protease
MRFRTLVVTVAVAALVVAAAPLADAAPSTEGSERYIVRFSAGTDPRAEASALARQGAQVTHIYTNVFPGLAAEVPAAALAGLARNPRVEAIESDGVAAATSETQSPVPSWGLDRVDQRALPLSGSYAYASGAAGVTAYVVDTGILATHTDFGGRVGPGYTAIADGQGTNDCNGHGTHVAGTIGGSAYGVAKQVSLIPVRVLGCTGSGTWSGVIAGLDWIAGHHAAGVPAVANMSLGGGASSSVDTAVQSVVNDGVPVAVAAGNDGADACTRSPARAPAALTVGATGTTDARASFSNYGTCLDLFAPGVSITSAWHTSTTAKASLGGTSMASPHVAGAAALVFAANPGISATQVAATVNGAATTGVVIDPRTGSPNRLLYTGADAPPPPPPAEIFAPDAPTNVTATAGKRRATVRWTQGADGGSPLTGQTIIVYRGTTRVGTVAVSGTATSVTVTGLKAGWSYSFSVTATNAVGTSPESVRSNAVTLTR